MNKQSGGVLFIYLDNLVQIFFSLFSRNYVSSQHNKKIGKLRKTSDLLKGRRIWGKVEVEDVVAVKVPNFITYMTDELCNKFLYWLNISKFVAKCLKIFLLR